MHSDMMVHTVIALTYLFLELMYNTPVLSCLPGVVMSIHVSRHREAAVNDAPPNAKEFSQTRLNCAPLVLCLSHKPHKTQRLP